MRVDLKVLGPPRASVSDDASAGSHLTQRRPFAVLAYLALARPRGPHARDSLMALFWPDADQPTARQGLRNALHRIRTAFGADLIVTSGEGLAVDPTTIACDAHQFEGAVREGRWKDALALYSGEFLAGFHLPGAPEFEHWLDVERRRFGDAAASAARSLASAAEAEGDIATAIAAASAACDLAPYDERSLNQLLELMAAEGARAPALQRFDDFAKRLADDLGAEPSPQLQATVREIRAGTSSYSASSLTVSAGGAVASHTEVERSVSRLDVPARVRRRRSVGALVTFGLAAIWVGLTLDRAPRSPLEVPAEISPFMVGLAERWRADTTHLSAYLRAYAELRGAGTSEARAAFQALVREAPLYAPGWAGLSVVLYRSGFGDMPPGIAMPQAHAAATRALALDPMLPGATETLIAYDLFYRWDLTRAKTRLDSAIVRHPDYPEFHNLLATWHRFNGDLDVSFDIKEQNFERDPLSPRYTYQIAASLYFAHRCAEAEVVHRRLPAEIRAVRGNTQLYRALACQGKDEEAADALRLAVLQAGDTARALAIAAARSAETRKLAVEAVFRDRLSRELARRKEGWSPPELVMLQYAELKHVDSTLVWLDSMYVDRSMMLYVVPFDPLNDFMRDDPRFQAFLDRLTWLGRAAP